MKPCILLIEDDQDMRDLVSGHLEHSGFDVQRADDGIKGQALALQYTPDLILLDLMLPKVDGLTLCQRLRRDDRTAAIPILMLTALGGTKDKVSGFNSGADDYLTKPFHNEELLARTKALIRRASGQANPTIQFGPISLDTVSEELSLNGQALDLTAYEYKVMEYLMLNPQKVISKTELTEHIYDQDFDLDSNVIEVFVGRLRKKLDPTGELKPIETLRGRGYRINRSL